MIWSNLEANQILDAFKQFSNNRLRLARTKGFKKSGPLKLPKKIYKSRLIKGAQLPGGLRRCFGEQINEKPKRFLVRPWAQALFKKPKLVIAFRAIIS